MQSSTHPGGNLYISLSERRGRLDLASSLDLSWARVASDTAYSRAYPSPPMSGSPSLPPRSNPDSSNRDHGSYVSTVQGPIQRPQPLQQEYQERGMGPPLQAFQERPPAGSYAPYRPEEIPQQLHFQQPQQQLPQLQNQHHHQQLHLQHMYAPQGPPPFPPNRPPIQALGHQAAKAQRKTKGHVASACVPCKRAHLRCDAQRPCSRCVSSGKEEACIDVQHKKRGRPRLRDDRVARYEVLGPSYPPPPDNSARRSLLMYNEAPYSALGEPPQRPAPYRVLKSQSGMGRPLSPRPIDYILSPTDTPMYGPSIPQTPRMFAPQEPICAYLNMEMQIAKVSPGFGETIGLQTAVSRRLHDIVSASDRDRVSRLQEALEEERRAREPNYLPPIYLKIEEDRLIQSISFGPDDMAQFRMERHERFAFQGPDGQQRVFQVRLGLAKKEWMYFVVLLLDVPMAQPIYPPQSPSYPRDPQYGFISHQQTAHPNPTPPSYMTTPMFSDHRVEAPSYRTPAPLGSNISPSMNMPTFAQPQMRQDYTQSHTPYQPPRNELLQSQPQRTEPLQSQPHPPGHEHDLQLPPIRGPHREGPPPDPMQRRDDRSGRVDIGGLLERRDHAGHGH